MTAFRYQALNSSGKLVMVTQKEERIKMGPQGLLSATYFQSRSYVGFLDIALHDNTFGKETLCTTVKSTASCLLRSN